MIQVLPAEVANQIAAGEVVERPASVVKELVENALDGGATHIEVRIDGGGTELIQVSDNGSGMSEEDVEKCFLRHATSKIKTIDDLFSIQSFGFRGEALAAISSVSVFSITTKTAQDEGIKLIIEKEKIVDKTSVASNVGTTVTVKNLFHTTPARLGYLKSDETEYRQCLKEVQAFALSNHHISFQLFKNDKLVLDLPKVDKPLLRAQQILKIGSEELLEVKGENTTTTISGFISAPPHFAGNRNHQHLFVNGRKIEDHRLAYALREAYVSSCGIEKHLYPRFVLFIQIDPIMVDVNVHPRKLEVKFSDPGDIFSLVKHSAISAINGNQGIYESKNLESRSSSAAPVPKFSSSSVNTFNQQLFSQPSFADRHEARSNTHQLSSSGLTRGSSNQASLDCPIESDNDNIKDLRFLAQLDCKYLLATNQSGDFYIFEQHALHERQRFDRFMEQSEKEDIASQPLLIPEEIKLSDDEISIIKEHQSEIETLGFQTKFPPDKGGGSQREPGGLMLYAVPQILKDSDFTQTFQDLVEYFINHQVGENIIERLLRRTLEYKACRGSVMFGDSLTSEEGQQLLDDFQKSRWRDLCPHGRPNHMVFNAAEIGKWFHRSI